MEWLANNLIEAILIIGVILLIIEVLVLGFSTFFLFFAGLAAIATALIMWTGIIPESFLSALISVSIFTLLFAAVLWKKLSGLQDDVDPKRAQSDLIGHSFILDQKLQAGVPMQEKSVYQYSGIAWRLDASQDIEKGKLVEVIQADVGSLVVKEKAN